MVGLQTYVAFAETVKHGSFAEAAREMGLSASAVAKGVARLEDDLGLRLLHRTTRKVMLTSDGRDLYERCRRIVDEIEALRDDAAGVRGEPSGTLRLNVPITLGRRVFVPMLAELLRKHPKIALDMGFSDRYADLVRESLDAVVRVGPLADSSLVARPIGEQRLLVCASPDYLKARGIPRTPTDLGTHACLVFRMPTSGRARPWQFRSGRRVFEVTPPLKVSMNDGEALVSAAVEGMGLVQVPDYMAADELGNRRLVEVLAAFRPPPTTISLVYVSKRRVTPRLRALIEAMSTSGLARVPPSACTDGTPALATGSKRRR